MTEARRTFLRQVMDRAWYVWRHRHVAGCNARTFADCLRNAWTYEKRATLPPVATAQTLLLRSMLQSPIRRNLTGQPYGQPRARAAGYYTSMVGA